MEIAVTPVNTEVKKNNFRFKTTVKNKLSINDEIIILKLDRKKLQFKAGQYVVLSFPNEKEAREYSVYSGEHDETIDILLKTVPAGSFSKRLGELSIGDELVIDGPYGFFVMNENETSTKKHWFIATGTGLSPFKSYIRTNPNLNYTLLHGIGKHDDKIEPNQFPLNRLKYCVSREHSNYFNGRVTDYLKQHKIEEDAIYHLCGNSEMINDVSDILEDNGILPENIRTEAFF